MLWFSTDNDQLIVKHNEYKNILRVTTQISTKDILLWKNKWLSGRETILFNVMLWHCVVHQYLNNAAQLYYQLASTYICFNVGLTVQMFLRKYCNFKMY